MTPHTTNQLRAFLWGCCLFCVVAIGAYGTAGAVKSIEMSMEKSQ